MRPTKLLAVLVLSVMTASGLLAQEKSKYADVNAVLSKSALQPGKDAVIAIVLDVKPKYHAQSHSPGDPNYIPFEVKLDENAAFTAGQPIYPDGEDKDFPALGKLNVYVGKIVTFVPITVKTGAKLGELKITGHATYQACDNALCYPPQKPAIEIETKVVSAGEKVSDNKPELFKDYKKAGPAIRVTTAPTRAAAPLPPAQNGSNDTGWGSWFSKPWFVWPVTAILVLMALGMFGLFTFRLPLGIYTIEPKHDTYLGNFLFGILTAVLSTPCTAPIFPGLLAWAVLQARSGGRFVGVGVITIVGVGMALPYLLLSGFPELARRIPRTGPWSELVKQMMGFLVLAVAGYFVGQQVLPGNQFMWVVFAIALAAGIFLIVRTAMLMPRTRPIFIATLVAIALSYSSFALAHTLTRKSLVAWMPYSADAVAHAREEGKLAVVDFTAKWCANCQLIDATVYANPKTLEKLATYDLAMFKADLTNDKAPGSELVTQLNPAGGIPITAIYSPKREKPYVLTSIYSSRGLLAALDAAKTGAPFGEEGGKDMSYLVAFGLALVVGLIFNLMPCVLPVLPLKAIGFYEVSRHNRAKSLSYGLVFSLGIIATFAVLALLVLPVAGKAAVAAAH